MMKAEIVIIECTISNSGNPIITTMLGVVVVIHHQCYLLTLTLAVMLTVVMMFRSDKVRS